MKTTYPDYRLEADNFSRKERREEIPFSGNSSFHDFLERQLGERSLTDQETKIAEYIIGNIDDNGYLQRPIAAISDDLIFQIGIDVSVEKLDELLQLIQDFEPAGVGAVQPKRMPHAATRAKRRESGYITCL